MIGLLLLGLGGIALLLFLVLALRLQAFVALLLVSIIVALVGGVPVTNLAKTIEDGLGGSLGHIALIIALGAMIGRIIEESGGAEALARGLIARFGDRRVPLALTIVGFLVGIPVFFEVGVIMLMPLAYGVARGDVRRLLPAALPMCLALLVVHALLPPHPGAVAVAGLLHADIGRMLMFGLPIAALTVLVTRGVAAVLARGDVAISDEVASQFHALAEAPRSGDEEAPPVGLIAFLIVLPIGLILANTVASLTLRASSPVATVLSFTGIPFVALLGDVLLCAYVLGIRRGWSRQRVADVLGAASQAFRSLSSSRAPARSSPRCSS